MAPGYAKKVEPALHDAEESCFSTVRLVTTPCATHSAGRKFTLEHVTEPDASVLELYFNIFGTIVPSADDAVTTMTNNSTADT